MNWLDFPDDDRFTVDGLAWWKETSPKLQRFPERMRDGLRPPVWGLSQAPSGGRIRFVTDATELGIRAHFPHLNHMNNMPRTGQLGIDLWVDGEHWSVLIPTDSEDLEASFFEGRAGVRREICMYLGLYGPVQVQAISMNEGASLEPPAPFALDLPVVYYGSSITQGGCASRAGNSYQAVVSRALNLDFVNLGFSGQGRGEPEVAEAVREIDASCYVMDWCQNVAEVDEFERLYAPFVEIIRETRPDTPIICVTPIFSTSEVTSDNAVRLDAMREIVRAVVAERRSGGDGAIEVVEGYDMLGPDDRDGLVDTSHPNDIGFASMARGIELALRRSLPL